MTKDSTYQTRSYKVFMPESEVVRTVLVNKLINQNLPNDMPITKVEMPQEHGFFRGVEYTERNTLLEFANDKWQKMTIINFGEGGKNMFGSNEIKKTGKLTKIDKAIKETVLSAWRKQKAIV